MWKQATFLNHIADRVAQRFDIGRRQRLAADTPQYPPG